MKFLLMKNDIFNMNSNPKYLFHRLTFCETQNSRISQTDEKSEMYHRWVLFFFCNGGHFVPVGFCPRRLFDRGLMALGLLSRGFLLRLLTGCPTGGTCGVNWNTSTFHRVVHVAVN